MFANSRERFMSCLFPKNFDLVKSYKIADKLFPSISNYCYKCRKCCFTYGFLLKEEAKNFIKIGFPVIQLNRKIYCFDSFKRNKKGKRIINKIPRCIFYKNGKCIIYKYRPLDCRLYPLKVRFEQNQGIIGISLDCKYIKSLNFAKREKICFNVIKFLKNIPNALLNDYLETMYMVFKISKKKEFRIKKIIKIIRIKNEKWYYSRSILNQKNINKNYVQV